MSVHSSENFYRTDARRSTPNDEPARISSEKFYRTDPRRSTPNDEPRISSRRSHRESSSSTSSNHLKMKTNIN